MANWIKIIIGVALGALALSTIEIPIEPEALGGTGLYLIATGANEKKEVKK